MPKVVIDCDELEILVKQFKIGTTFWEWNKTTEHAWNFAERLEAKITAARVERDSK